MSVGALYGKYFLLKKLAAGGMGEVYLARQQGPAGFEKILVIKRILNHLTENQDFVDLFLQEARLQARMSHAAIVSIFDLGQADDGSFYLAMDFVHGKSLNEVVQRAGKLKERMPAALAAQVLEKAADGLAYAHSLADNQGVPLNLIHRDISPHNILVSYQGEVKLIDFGIAKSDSNVVKTETGTIKGKFFYMSPEQSAAHKLDKRSDIFALGICLYECLTGANPFVRDNVVLSLEAIQKTDPPLPSTVDPTLMPLDAIVMKALAKDRELRYQDAADLRDDLQRVRASGQLPVPPERLGQFMARMFKDKLEAESKVLREADASSPNAVPPGGTPPGSAKVDAEAANATLMGKPGTPATASKPPAVPPPFTGTVMGAPAPIDPAANQSTMIGQSLSSMGQQGAAAVAPPPAGSKGKLIGIGVGAVLLVGVGGFAMFGGEKKADPGMSAELEAAKKEGQRQAIAQRKLEDEKKAEEQRKAEEAKQAAAQKLAEEKKAADAKADEEKKAAAEAKAEEEKKRNKGKVVVASTTTQVTGAVGKSFGTLIVKPPPGGTIAYNNRPVNGIKVELTSASGNIDVMGPGVPFKVQVTQKGGVVGLSTEPWAVVRVNSQPRGKTPIDDLQLGDELIKVELKSPAVEQPVTLMMRLTKP